MSSRCLFGKVPPAPPGESSSGPESGGGSGKAGDLNKDVYRWRTMDGGGGSWAPAQPRGRISRLVMAHPAWPPPRARSRDRAAPRPCSSGCGQLRPPSSPAGGWALRPTKPPRAAPTSACAPEGSCPQLVERREGSRRDSEKASTHCPLGSATRTCPRRPLSFLEVQLPLTRIFPAFRPQLNSLCFHLLRLVLLAQFSAPFSRQLAVRGVLS